MHPEVSDLLREAAQGAPPPRYDVDDAVRAGKRRQRRLRAGAGLAAVAAVTVAIGVPQLTSRADGPPPVPAGTTSPVSTAPTAAAAGAPGLTYTLRGYTVGNLRVDNPFGWNLAGETAIIRNATSQQGEITLYHRGVDPRSTLEKAKITPTAAIGGRPAYRVEAAGTPMLLWEYADDAMALAKPLEQAPGRWTLTQAELRQVAEALHPGAPYPVTLAFGTSYVPAGYRIVGITGGFSEGMISSAQLMPTDEAAARIGKPDPDHELQGRRVNSLLLWLGPAYPSDHGAPRPGVICPDPKPVKGIPADEGTHCYAFLPGGKNVLDVFGPHDMDRNELRKLLDNALFAKPGNKGTWFSASTAFPPSARVGGA